MNNIEYDMSVLIVSECDNMTYGMDCMMKCGHCAEEEPCNPVTGLCPKGCAAGWTGERCTSGVYLVFDRNRISLYLARASLKQICYMLLSV